MSYLAWVFITQSRKDTELGIWIVKLFSAVSASLRWIKISAELCMGIGKSWRSCNPVKKVHVEQVYRGVRLDKGCMPRFIKIILDGITGWNRIFLAWVFLTQGRKDAELGIWIVKLFSAVSASLRYKKYSLSDCRSVRAPFVNIFFSGALRGVKMS